MNLVAHRVATPVLERLGPEAVRAPVLGTAGATAYLGVNGFVVAVSGGDAVAMPNAIAVNARRGSLSWPGSAEALIADGLVRIGPAAIRWAPDAAPAWNPRVPPAEVDRRRLAEDGTAILRACGIDAADEHAVTLGLACGDGDRAQDGATELGRALERRDAECARHAAALLAGRGPGLTPQGDDVLAGVALAVGALAGAAGWSRTETQAFLAALCSAAVRRRTTPLGATLLELAARGHALEPAGALLAFGPAGERRRSRALARLGRVGHTTGRAYAVAIGAAAVRLSGTTTHGRRNRP